MTVKELISKLENCDPNMVVTIQADEQSFSESREITGVSVLPDPVNRDMYVVIG